MVLPQAVLRAANRGPVLVELKSGDAYSGTLAAVDNLMNIRLEDVVFTPRTEHKFEKMAECTIKGQYVKFIRFPDDILDRLVARHAEAGGSSGSRKGRGKDKGPKAGEVNKMLTVPAAMIGAIIGRGGESIKNFCTDSGARIEVSKDQLDTAEERAIFLSGSQECVDKAEELIMAFVKERTASSRGKGQGQGRGGGGKGRSAQGEARDNRGGRGINRGGKKGGGKPEGGKSEVGKTEGSGASGESEQAHTSLQATGELASGQFFRL
eukprot:TRINITY_DN94494_c0_g1_i1.p1 TRINITY_DN94494_c0_g1~~TRINITY_DN94494_c0_g1_i1.p1  ORF type:complete len:266 (+),score=63.01 TRINITY_DN94494_c0_g1_i1:34-831(+)